MAHFIGHLWLCLPYIVITWLGKARANPDRQTNVHTHRQTDRQTDVQTFDAFVANRTDRLDPNLQIWLTHGLDSNAAAAAAPESKDKKNLEQILCCFPVPEKHKKI